MASRRKPANGDPAAKRMAGASVAPTGFFGKLLNSLKKLVKRG